MPIIVNDNFRNNSPKSLDNKYLKNGTTAYISTAEAVSSIPLAYRHIGLTVLVGNKEYWWRDGKADNQLIEKYEAPAGASGGGAGEGNLFN